MSQWSQSRTPEVLFWDKVNNSPGLGPKGDCWLWMAARRGNKTSAQTPDKFYGCFRYEDSAQLAHRVAWMLTKGDIPDGMEVLHSCDNPPCVNPAHLFLGTHGDNMRDCWTKGRGRIPKSDNKGSKHGNAKLNERKVLKMRSMAATGDFTYTQLAEIFGVHRMNVSCIVRRKTWRHV